MEELKKKIEQKINFLKEQIQNKEEKEKIEKTREELNFLLEEYLDNKK